MNESRNPLDVEMSGMLPGGVIEEAAISRQRPMTPGWTDQSPAASHCQVCVLLSPGSGPRLQISTASRSPGCASLPSLSFTLMGPLR